MLKTLWQFRLHIIFIFVLILGALVVHFQYSSIVEIEEKDWERRLNTVHVDAINKFQRGVNEFATLISGIKAFVDDSPEVPDAERLQAFVNNQIEFLPGDNNLVISYIDTSQIFRISFTPDAIDPARLVGRKVSTLRSEEELSKLKAMMISEELVMFEPLNLVEGWAGLPIDFGVIKNGVSLGYFAPIINLKNILNLIYEGADTEDFVFKFSFVNGPEFDREVVYDGSEIHNKNRDSERYTNFDIKKDDFVFNTFKAFGEEIEIGSASKEPFKYPVLFAVILYGWYFAIAAFSLITLFQVYKFSNLNKQIKNINADLIEKNKVITEQNERMENLVATKNKFFSIIAHDLKGPMGAMSSALGLLEEEYFPEKETRDLVRDTSESSKNIVRLLLNLLDWSRIQSGELKMNLEMVDLSLVVNDVFRLLSPLARRKNVNLFVHLPPEMHAWCDANMMNTILRNLINNALKFTRSYGKVEVTGKVEDDLVAIKVLDTGIGMSEEDMRNLFKLQGQHQIEGTSGEKGTGLGLILVKDLIEKQNGTVRVLSKESKGSIFTITIPRKSPDS